MSPCVLHVIIHCSLLCVEEGKMLLVPSVQRAIVPFPSWMRLRGRGGKFVGQGVSLLLASVLAFPWCFRGHCVWREGRWALADAQLPAVTPACAQDSPRWKIFPVCGVSLATDLLTGYQQQIRE